MVHSHRVPGVPAVGSLPQPSNSGPSEYTQVQDARNGDRGVALKEESPWGWGGILRDGSDQMRRGTWALLTGSLWHGLG